MSVYLLISDTALLFCPFYREMHKRGFLLFGRESVEELEQGDFLIVLLFLLALYAIADAFTLYDDRSTVIGFGKGQHVVVRKAYALSTIE